MPSTPAPPLRRPAWPYPRWIAHRGAGLLAPENTLAAFRLGAQHGYRMFECDAKLSADEVVVLLHDADLARTSNGQGLAGDHTWAHLSQLDAGSWHSPAYAGEPLGNLQSLAAFCQAHGHHLNIEIKPTPGQERHTGEKVAEKAAQWWAGQTVPPLLSSFQPEALEGASATAPHLPRGLLRHHWDAEVLPLTASLACQALICHHSLWTAERVQEAQQRGLRTLSYTVNEEAVARQLLAWGLDGIITDRVDLFKPDAA